jgi:hypothetical protein
VLECIPFTVRQIANQSHRGNRCVVKVGPVGEAGKELARYERYVKFFRTSQRRVELLGQAYGDTLTAICYSFAGGSNTPADSLEDILEKKDLRALDCLGLSYSPRAREWFKDVSSGQSVWKFFESVHFQHDKPINLLDKLHSDLVNWELPELAALLPGPRTLPVQADIGAQYCIVHGDMNAGNIMMANFPSNPIDFEATRAREEWWERRVAAIASDSAWAGGQRTAGAVASSPASDGLLGAKAILIDYRHTRRGPVFIDFAALECSIRGMPECVYNRGDLHAIANDYDREISLWKLAWEKDPFESCGRDQWRGLGYWGAASYELIQLARRNFEGTQDFAGEHALRKKLTRDAWKKEYAATCMLYALRLLKYEDFGDIRVREASGRTDKSLRNETRVRIAVWIAALSQTY